MSENSFRARFISSAYFSINNHWEDSSKPLEAARLGVEFWKEEPLDSLHEMRKRSAAQTFRSGLCLALCPSALNAGTGRSNLAVS